MICPTTFAPAVFASDASSPSGSRGSAVDPGRITPTSTAFSWRTDNSVRFSSAKSLLYEGIILAARLLQGEHFELAFFEFPFPTDLQPENVQDLLQLLPIIWH